MARRENYSSFQNSGKLIDRSTQTHPNANIMTFIFVADTRSAIRNDLQRPVTSGIGVQEPRDLNETSVRGV